MNENEPGNLYWDRLYTDFPDFQVALVDGDELLAEAHAIPLPWDGTLDDLPSGWDEGFVRGMTSDRPHDGAHGDRDQRRAEPAGAAALEPDDPDVHRQRARGRARDGVIAPVRPTWKERYPLIPIEQLHRVAARRRVPLRPLDPHPRARRRRDPRAGARVDDRSARRRRTGRSGRACAFPADGEYVFPGGLATLVVERRHRHARRAERLGAPPRLIVRDRRLAGQRDRDRPRTTTRPSRSSERTASSSSVVELVRRDSATSAERRRAALAERALERPCLRAGSSRIPRDGHSSASGHVAAARDAGEADRRAEIHQRLRRRGTRTRDRCGAGRARRSRRRAGRPRRRRSSGPPRPCTGRRRAAR